MNDGYEKLMKCLGSVKAHVELQPKMALVLESEGQSEPIQKVGVVLQA